jgi:hypothetical protein
MLNGGTNLTIRGNIVYGWPDALEIWKPAICCVPSNNRIVGNALYVNAGGTDLCTWNQSLQYHIVDNSTIAQIQTQVQNLGVIDSNYVSDFAPSPFTYKSQAANPGSAVKLAAWRTYSGKDANTVTFPSTSPEFQYNATATPTTYTFTGRQKRDFRGTVYNNSATIPAYYGNIFFDNGPATTPVTLTVTATPTAIACNGGSSTVTVSASGGTAPYSGTGTFSRTAGTHTFNVTDAAAYSGSATITITQPSVLAVSASAGTISTPGGSTNVVISASGGTAPYTGTGTFSRTAGVHTFTVTDNNACVSTAIVSLSNPVVVPAQSIILNNKRIVNGN